MEVKIKEGNGYVDAEWTIQDGVMVVSPKEVKFEPKDGDIVAVHDGKHIFINKDYRRCGTGYAYLGWNFDNDMIFNECVWNYSRLATKEEKKLLFDKLAENGFEWDAEKKQLVKLKWKPGVGQRFYYPEYDNGDCVFIIKAYTYAFEDQIERDKAITKDWCFKTSKECQEFCDRLNESIENVKP